MRSGPTNLEVQLYQLRGMEYLRECTCFESIIFVFYLVGKEFKDHRPQETLFT
jgi:hypothetical protein